MKEQAPPPTSTTAALFNKTVLEKLSSVLTTNVLTTSTTIPDKCGCSTCGRNEPYRYRFKISDVQNDLWYPICLNCRARLVCVCDFYQFIRNIRQGLYAERTAEELYIEALSLKRMMFYTRIGTGNCGNPESVFTNLSPLFANTSNTPTSLDIVPTP
jgi:hypothetical protein